MNLSKLPSDELYSLTQDKEIEFEVESVRWDTKSYSCVFVGVNLRLGIRKIDDICSFIFVDLILSEFFNSITLYSKKFFLKGMKFYINLIECELQIKIKDKEDFEIVKRRIKNGTMADILDLMNERLEIFRIDKYEDNDLLMK